MPAETAIKISLELKKLLVDGDMLDLSQAALEAALFRVMARRSFGEDFISRFRMVTSFHLQARARGTTPGLDVSPEAIRRARADCCFAQLAAAGSRAPQRLPCQRRAHALRGLRPHPPPLMWAFQRIPIFVLVSGRRERRKRPA